MFSSWVRFIILTQLLQWVISTSWIFFSYSSIVLSCCNSYSKLSENMEKRLNLSIPSRSGCSNRKAMACWNCFFKSGLCSNVTRSCSRSFFKTATASFIWCVVGGEEAPDDADVVALLVLFILEIRKLSSSDDQQLDHLNHQSLILSLRPFLNFKN